MKRANYTLEIYYAADCMPSFFYLIMVEGYAAPFRCTAVVQASDLMTASIAFQ